LSDINKSNYYFSNYWKNLICKIEENKLNINWGFFFLPKKKGDADLAIKNIENCKNIHRNSIFIHGFISYAIVIKVITLWFLLQVRWLFIGVQRLSNLNKYWYGALLVGDLKKAYCGPEAVTNLFEIYLFSSLLKSIPRQNKGLFLMENLGWEKSLIYFWKKYGHGDLIGCPHTIIRFWDLRYFGDTMKENSPVLSEIPQPDKIAVNGPTSLKMLNEGYQSNKLIPVEAQRYEHLLDVKYKFMDFNEIQTILIVGDISINNSDLMVREIANHHVFFNGKYKLIYKPHPAISSHTSKIKKLNYDISHDDIQNLLRVANIVICSTYTSVAIDARYLGIPVINFLNKNDFNMSPFRDSNCDFNVDNGVDIVKIISSFNFKNIKKLRENRFFWLSSDYKLWIKALKNE
jgi:surface carbohydrate biosynthesis protein (TIGR04326 family)